MSDCADTRNGIRPPWVQFMLCMGISAGVFTAIVAAFLVADRLRAGEEKPPTSPRLEALLERYRQGETGQELREMIRAEDVRIRREILGRQTFNRRGAWLLLFGGSFMIAGFLAYAASRPAPVSPPELDPEAIENEARERRVAAVGAAVVGAMLLAALLALAAWNRAAPMAVATSERAVANE